jgi:hypothetical protein
VVHGMYVGDEGIAVMMMRRRMRKQESLIE